MSLIGKLAQLGIYAANGAKIIFENGIATEGDIEQTGDFALTGDITQTGDQDITGDVTISGAVNRIGQQYMNSMAGVKVGATAGWAVNAADDVARANLLSSNTASTLVIPITVPMHIGAIVTGFSVAGRIASTGGTVTLDASLYKHVISGSSHSTVEIGAITQVSVTETTGIDNAKSGLEETLAATETLYILITATTAASTSIAIQGVTITVTDV